MKNNIGKVAIITGASRGIGKAIALKLDRKGFITVLVSHNREKLKEALKDFSKRAIIVPTDVSREEEVVSLTKKVIKKFGRIDVLVNSAGFHTFKKIDDLSREDFEETIGANLGGAFYCTRECVKQMKKQFWGGQIVNINSVMTKAPFLYSSKSLHLMTKAGAAAFDAALRNELKREKIKIATIFPGIVFTELLTEIKTRDPIELKKYALRPEDVAEVVWTIVRQGKNSNITEVVMEPLQKIKLLRFMRNE